MSKSTDAPGEASVPRHEPPPSVSLVSDQDSDVELIDLAVIMAQNIRLLVYGPLLGGLIALGLTFLVTPTFTARTSFVPPQQQQNASTAMIAQLGSLAGLATTAGALKNPADQFVALLKSTSIANNLVDRFNLVELYGTDLRHDAREELASRTSISSGKDGLIIVQVDDESPDRAAKIANAYVSELQALLGRLALTEAQQRRAFFERQLDDTRRNLAQAQRTLASVGLTPSALKANPELAVEGVATLQARVTAQEVRLSVMRGHLTEAAPEFIQAQNELAALRAQLRKAEASEPKFSQGSAYIDSFRTFKYYEALFEIFARQFELAKVDEAREGALLQVVDIALLPERKSRPKRAVIAALTSFAIGLALVLGLVVTHSIAASTRSQEGARKLAAIRRGFAKLITRGTDQ